MADMNQLEKHNGSRFVWAHGLQGVGDQLLSGKTVLPWILGPGFFTAMLVPVRESLSMLPQAALTPWVTTQKSRKRVWMIGSMGQGISAALIGVAAMFLHGWPLGLTTVILMGILATFRSLCSIASKDVQGRTISKGNRGKITGRATELAGAISLIIGLALMFVKGHPIPLIFIAAGGWFAATAVFSTIEEPEEDVTPIKRNWWSDTWNLFFHHTLFRRFVIVRSLMLVTALSTSFVVMLSQEVGHDIKGLGFFVISSALASLVGGRVSGMLSDVSSKNVMAGAAATASIAIAIMVATASVAPWILPVGFFVIALAHTAIRVGRQTYIVDMAEGDDRTRFTGAANTIMGIILLIVGAISGALGSPRTALIFLAILGFVGVIGASRLQDVSRKAAR